jgi:hypothetical protein
MTTGFQNSFSLFVTSNGDIYIDNGEKNGHVEKWIPSTSQYSTVLFVCPSCTSLFIDRNYSIYCSMSKRHQVAKGDLFSLAMTMTIVAGTGSAGSALNQLHSPLGVFFDEYFGLYVADCENNRVQRFRA